VTISYKKRLISY